jgi:hypothetical protein
MNALFARLQDVNEAGAFRLNCPPEELRAAVAQAGFALFEADLAAVHGKGELLAAVAQALKAPEWFGNNWDALADALGDLSWQPAPGYVLLLHNGGETLGLSEAEHKVATEIFGGTVSFWMSQGKPFWVFFG